MEQRHSWFDFLDSIKAIPQPKKQYIVNHVCRKKGTWRSFISLLIENSIMPCAAGLKSAMVTLSSV